MKDKASEIVENGKERIRKVCEYLQIWKDTTISLDEYVNLRKPKNNGKLASIEEHYIAIRTILQQMTSTI